ncbi:hypothetical protein [Pannonibacter phragmitetus]|uniref:hypothetical protein n=1 Tax=Pannonibacter phragmitetus TaxID=121719 RepID=UPI00197CE54C|nr:hypothetical protein [Pannonibacter phragmitetus]
MRESQSTRCKLTSSDFELIDQFTSAVAKWKLGLHGADQGHTIEYRAGNPNLYFADMQFERLRTAVQFQKCEYENYKGKATFSAQIIVKGDLDVIFRASLPTSHFGQSCLSMQFPLFDYANKPCNITSGCILGENYTSIA